VLHATQNPDTLWHVDLPDRYVIKANNGFDRNVVIEDAPGLGPVSKRRIADKCKRWLATPFGTSTNETHYVDIEPWIFAEEYLDIEREVRFHCFNGEVVFIDDLDVGGDCSGDIYTRDWRQLNVDTKYTNTDDLPLGLGVLFSSIETLGVGAARALTRKTRKKRGPPPDVANLVRLVESDVRATLPGINYVRVDTYLTENADADADSTLYFGEYTFTPRVLGTFYVGANFSPRSFDDLLTKFLVQGYNELNLLEEHLK